MSPHWNFLADATRMSNRKGFHENYEVVFPKLSDVAFTSFSLFAESLLREEQKDAGAGTGMEVARVASARNLRGDYDFFGTRPGGKLFSPRGPLLLDIASVHIHIYTRQVTYRFCISI